MSVRSTVGGALALLLATACADQSGGYAPAPPFVPVSAIFDATPACVGEADGGVAAPVDAGDAAEPARAPGKVVVISVDGLRPDAIFRAPADNLLALACAGAYSWRARTILPSLTLPSHASMVSGQPPERHMIFHDEVRPGFISVPTVLALAHQAGRRVVMVVGKQKLSQLAPPGTTDVFALVPDSDAAIIDRAVAEAALGFDLLFVHLPEVDLVGHLYGWMSPAYLAQVRRSDGALGRLLAVLPPEVTVLVTADHGGSGYLHWSSPSEDLSIPWLVRGPGVRAGRSLAAAISTVDTAATTAWLLGLPPLVDAPAQVVLEAWQP